MSTLSEKINQFASQAKLDSITNESNEGYAQLPEGCYLCEVTKWELRETKKTQEPMYMLSMQIVQNGVSINEETGDFIELKGTKNRYLNLMYVINSTEHFENFVSDMLKFEQDVGVPLLEKEYFNYDETISDALDLVVGKRLWVQVQSYISKVDGEVKYSNKALSFARAEKMQLELPF